MNAKEFVEKYKDNSEVTLAFGADYIVALHRETYQEVERLDFRQAGAIAMLLLQDMVARAAGT